MLLVWTRLILPDTSSVALDHLPGMDTSTWVVGLRGQAEYVMVPYADFNLLKFPAEIRRWKRFETSPVSLTSCRTATTEWLRRVGPGSAVYVTGTGPIGLVAAASAHLPGVAVVIVGGVNPVRISGAKAVGFETVDLSLDAPLGDQLRSRRRLLSDRPSCRVSSVILLI